ncbi:MAG: hypothetical protein IKE55_03215 [Kiritimatiellae bacterium]|nr:hypothetical protein [Kiritimatiellia bacterium]
MRSFGKDAPEFLAFTIGDSGDVHRFPLAASMSVEELCELQDAANVGGATALRFQVELLRRHIGEAADGLTAGDVAAIYEAWNEESARQGATAGE